MWRAVSRSQASDARQTHPHTQTALTCGGTGCARRWVGVASLFAKNELALISLREQRVSAPLFIAGSGSRSHGRTDLRSTLRAQRDVLVRTRPGHVSGQLSRTQLPPDSASQFGLLVPGLSGSNGYLKLTLLTVALTKSLGPALIP